MGAADAALRNKKSENPGTAMTHREIHLFLRGPLSQWYLSNFSVEGMVFNCAEQFMMHRKAILFGDTATASAILATRKPAEQKRLGRLVSGFDVAIWGRNCVQIVTTGNVAKFSQNEELKKYLLGTGDDILAEANPQDPIWGIALAETNPDAKDPEKWRGKNLLGNILMDVRNQLRA
jgi:hypothetical protein